MYIPTSHPRYQSLKIRELVEEGVKNGITSLNGLIAHGRGEAFDYLLGERTHDFAKKAIDASAALLLSAKRPVISVNGNTAALIPQELITLSKILHAPLEINLFHKSEERLDNIKNHLFKHGAQNVLLPQENSIMAHLESDRKYVHPQGIIQADVVLVPLEDGDRTEALIKNGKKVITVDLNPLSRTSQKATITIVDNIIRAMPLLNKKIEELKENNAPGLDDLLSSYKNTKMLTQAERQIRSSK